MNNIRQIRKEHGMSQLELSKLLGKSQQAVSRIENSENLELLPAGIWIELSRIFGVSVEELIEKSIFSDGERQESEFLRICQQLNEENKETLTILARRLYETQKTRNEQER